MKISKSWGVVAGLVSVTSFWGVSVQGQVPVPSLGCPTVNLVARNIPSGWAVQTAAFGLSGTRVSGMCSYSLSGLSAKFTLPRFQNYTTKTCGYRVISGGYPEFSCPCDLNPPVMAAVPNDPGNPPVCVCQPFPTIPAKPTKTEVTEAELAAYSKAVQDYANWVKSEVDCKRNHENYTKALETYNTALNDARAKFKSEKSAYAAACSINNVFASTQQIQLNAKFEAQVPNASATIVSAPAGSTGANNALLIPLKSCAQSSASVSCTYQFEPGASLRLSGI